MGKLDGMDPKLVRDLLSEVRQAAEQMRSTEGQVTRLMSVAGLSSHSVHRPSQIADACDTMVRDVSARVELLERRVKQGGGSPERGGERADEPRAAEAEKPKVAGERAEAPENGEAKTQTSEGETSKGAGTKPGTPRAEDLKPAVKPDGGHHDGGQAADRVREDGQRSPSRPDSGHDTGSDARPDRKPEGGSKADETSPREGRSGGSGGGSDGGGRSPSEHGVDTKGDVGSKADETSPREARDGRSGGSGDPGGSGGDSDGGGRSSSEDRGDPKGHTGSKGDETSPRDAREAREQGDARDSRDSRETREQGERHSGRSGDQDDGRSPADHKGGDHKGDVGSKGEERSPGGDGKVEILDTPGKDHPDDVDRPAGDGPRVVDVHGVRTLQIPLDAPTAAEVGELLKHIEDIPLLDAPAADGDLGANGAAEPALDRPEGSGRAEPYEPLTSAKPAFPIPDTVEPALDQPVRPHGAHSGEGVLSQWAREAGHTGTARVDPDPYTSGAATDGVSGAEPSAGRVAGEEVGGASVWATEASGATGGAGSGSGSEDVPWPESPSGGTPK